MKMRTALICLLLACWSATGADAAKASAAKPGITIVSPSAGAVIHGSSITIRVQVRNFSLIPPVLLSPARWKTIPLLTGNRGHIHYILDNVANLVLARDVTTMTDHTWTNVLPGPHTITAYLANSQHAPFPGVPMATLHVTVVRNAAPTPSIKITGLAYRRSSHVGILIAHVTVSHFKLVPPVFQNPPVLSGNQGHIHYVLDSIDNFKATRDAATALVHPWSGIGPGRHTILAYLATSRHQLFPGTQPAQAAIVIPGARAHAGTVRVVTILPRTGGGSRPVQTDTAPGLPAAATTILILGLAALRRRRR